MSDPFRSKATGVFDALNVGTNAGVTATASASPGNKYVVTHIAFSGDAAALVTLTWTKGGSTKNWKKRFSAAFSQSEVFPPGEITGDTNTAVTLNISASTANCEANILGYTINGL